VLHGHQEHLDEIVSVPYRLPVSIARFTCDVVTTTDQLHPDAAPKTTRTPTVSLDVHADPRPEAARSIIFAGQEWNELKVTLNLKEDGRLTGTDTEVTASSDHGLQAALTTGLTLGATALQMGAPPLLAGIGGLLGGVAVAAAPYVIHAAEAPRADFMPAKVEPAQSGTPNPPAAPTSTPPRDPTPTELKIEAAFMHDHEADGKRLYQYRLALLHLTLQHAATSAAAYTGNPGTARDTLHALDKVLASVRAEARQAEAVYSQWLDSKQKSSTEHLDYQIYIDELPTRSELEAVAIAGLNSLPLNVGDATARWAVVAEKVGVMMTCDMLSAPHNSGSPPGDANATRWVQFRSPMIAKVTHWTVAKNDAPIPGWTITPTETDWALVTDPRNMNSLRLPVASDSTDSLSLTFADSGGLSAVASDTQGRLTSPASAVTAVTGGLGDAVTTATSMAAALSPTAAKAAVLKNKIDLLNQQATLQGLVNPAPNDLAGLQSQLAEAQLQAQLAVATRIANDPSAVTITTQLAN